MYRQNSNKWYIDNKWATNSTDWSQSQFFPKMEKTGPNWTLKH